MENGQYVDGSLYFYAPNKAAPVVWAVLFAISAVVHIYQCQHFKAWKYTALYPAAGIIFVAGYIMREVSAFMYGEVKVYISTVCLIYAAPPLYELANYIILGRILYYVPYHSPLHPGRVLTTFGGISAIVEALNGNGASYSSNASLPDHQQAVGRALIKAALILQLFVITSFVALAVYFQRRCSKHGLLPANLRNALYTLYASAALILIRTIYRTVEYLSIASLATDVKQPNFDPQSLSPIIRYEWFFWLFEAVLMLLNSALINWRHPARYLPQSNKVFLAEDGVTEIEGPGYEDKRNLVLTILDPFDLVGIVKGRDKEKYWLQGPSQSQAGEGAGASASAQGDVKVKDKTEVDGARGDVKVVEQKEGGVAGV